VTHACNPNYSGGRDQEDHGLKPAPGGVTQGVGPEYKPKTCQKKKKKKKNNSYFQSGSIAQVCLPSKCKALSSNSSTTKKNSYSQMDGESLISGF
jgi:hypothetical protein